MALSITSASTMVVDSTLSVSVANTADEGASTLAYQIMNDTGSAFVDSDGVITAISAGAIMLTVTSSKSQVSASQKIEISKATPVFLVNAPSSMKMGAPFLASVSTSATYSRGGAISFSIIAGTGSATVDSSTGSIIPMSEGTVTLMARSAGDEAYFAASASQIITIEKDASLPDTVKNGENSPPKLHSNESANISSQTANLKNIRTASVNLLNDSDNIGGLSTIGIAYHFDFRSSDPMEFFGEKDWQQIEFSGEAELIRQTKNTPNGLTYTYSGFFTIPRIDAQVETALMKFVGLVSALRIEDQNGQVYILGRPGNPVLLEEESTTGKDPVSRNAYIFRFLVTQINPANST